MSRYLKFHGTRETQLTHLRSKGWTVLNVKSCPLVLAFHTDPSGCTQVKAWNGAADKPTFFYSFSTQTKAESYVADYVKKTTGVAEWKATKKAENKARRANLKAADHYMVGDVLYHTWGYDQTNVDWRQVVEVKAKSIVIRPIKSIYAETNGHMSGVEQPCRNEFSGEPMVKHLDETGSCGLSKWTGRAVTSTHYA